MITCLIFYQGIISNSCYLDDVIEGNSFTYAIKYNVNGVGIMDANDVLLTVNSEVCYLVIYNYILYVYVCYIYIYSKVH